jgi:hypothetical protein
MKVLLIRGHSPVPGRLRDVIARGSTSLEERGAAELNQSSPSLDVDRVVFWNGGGDAAVVTAANSFLGEPPNKRGDKLVFVSSDSAPSGPSGLAANEQFVWPRDEDRLKMAFMTGA